MSPDKIQSYNKATEQLVAFSENQVPANVPVFMPLPKLILTMRQLFLTPDVRKQVVGYSGFDGFASNDPSAGFCAASSFVTYWTTGADLVWTPYALRNYRDEMGIPVNDHVWLRNRFTGKIIDPTKTQFPDGFWYYNKGQLYDLSHSNAGYTLAGLIDNKLPELIQDKIIKQQLGNE